MVLWNQRMNQLTGDSKYIDILERSLYNGALAGISLVETASSMSTRWNLRVITIDKNGMVALVAQVSFHASCLLSEIISTPPPMMRYG